MSKETALASIPGAVAPTPAPTTNANAGAPLTVDSGNAVDSTRFAQLAKKEARQVQRDLELKKKEETLKTLEADLQKKMVPFNEFEKLKETDKIAAMRSLGFTETDIFNFLADKKVEPTIEEKAAAAAQATIDKARKEDADKAIALQKEHDQKLITRFKGEFPKLALADPEKFEYVTHNGEAAFHLAFTTANQILADTGEMISAQEALEIVESFYEEEDKAMSGIKKRAPKLSTEGGDNLGKSSDENGARSRVVTDERGKPVEAPVVRARGITNAVTATAAATVKRRETPGEKRERLMEALRRGAKP